MNKVVIAIVAAVLVAAGGYYFLTKEDEEPVNEAPAQSQTEPNNTDNTQTTQGNGDAEHLAGANSGATLDATDQTEVAVSMEDFRFDPQVLKIKKGTVVTWTNNGDNGHDVVPASNSPKQFQGSQLLGNGQSYSFTFDEAGKYYYFCTPHSSQMRAIVEVVE